MRPRLFVLVCVMMLCVPAFATAEYAPDRVIIRFHPNTVEPLPGPAPGPLQDLHFQSAALRDSLLANDVILLQRLFPDFEHSDVATVNLAGEDVQLPDLADIYVANLVPGTPVEATALTLATLPSVMYAEPDYIMSVNVTDPLFNRQWGLHNTGSATCYGPYVTDIDINAPEAWTYTTGTSPGVPVGILDTGVQFNHLDFGDRVVLGPTYVPGTVSSNDDEGHGTAVAGLIGARGNNGEGIAGAAWGSIPVAVKVLGSNGSGENSWIAQGINWTRTQSIPVISMSFGGCGFSSAVQDVTLASLLAGQFVVASAGNTNTGQASFPAGYKRNVYAVGALYGDGRRWQDSNLGIVSGCRFCGSNYPCESATGGYLDAVAPGGRSMATTKRGGEYFDLSPCTNEFSGTSAAAPMASGIAALLRTMRPDILGEETEYVLNATARKLDLYGSSWNEQVGHGLLRADAALALISTPNRLSRALATNMELRVTFSTNVRLLGVPGLRDGVYPTQRYVMRKAISFSEPFTAVPAHVFVRASGTKGSSDQATQVYGIDYPAAKIVAGSITAGGCIVETNVHDVRDPNTNQHIMWYPVQPSQATVAVSAIGAGPDGIAPEAIQSLDSAPVCDSIRVRWTAPHEDGATGGRATEYDLRVSTTAITAANFAGATRLFIGAPQEPGSLEEYFHDVGHCSGLRYYAIKSRDEAGNWSGISNLPPGVSSNCSPFGCFPEGPEFSARAFADHDGIQLELGGVDGNAVEVAVYDIAGRVLERHVLNVGEEKRSLHLARTLASGVYLVSIRQGSHQKTVKMVTLR